MSNINKLNLSNGSWGLEDIRINNGTELPDAGKEGDIFLHTSSSVKTANDWTYVERTHGDRKIVECWKTINLGNISITGQWASGISFYYNANDYPSAVVRQYPVVFTSTPIVTFSIETTSYAGIIMTNSTQTTRSDYLTHAPAVRFSRASSSATVQNVTITYHVIGQVG